MRVRLKRVAVEAALVRRNWTKTALARLAGLHRTHLSDLLSGRTSPGPHTRQRILDILGGEFDDFFEIVRGRGQISEEERILGLIEYLGGRSGSEAAVACRRLAHLLETLRSRGWLAASDRSWLDGEWRAFQTARQASSGHHGSVKGHP